jgi:hypothetical protein
MRNQRDQGALRSGTNVAEQSELFWVDLIWTVGLVGRALATSVQCTIAAEIAADGFSPVGRGERLAHVGQEEPF